jgi:hypothetical protein
MTETTSFPRLVTGTRNGRYGEVLLAFMDNGIRLDVYNSYVLNECPQDLWDQLSSEEIAAEFGAVMAVLNGPRYWLMDGIGKVDNIAAQLNDFGGIKMNRVASITLDGPLERAPYREVSVNRGSIWFFDAGKEVFELRSADNKTYIMQAYCTGVDPSMSLDTLASLGERLSLPEGWTYSSRVLKDELKIDTTGSLATVLQDEFENTYSLVR